MRDLLELRFGILNSSLHRRSRVVQHKYSGVLVHEATLVWMGILLIFSCIIKSKRIILRVSCIPCLNYGKETLKDLIKKKIRGII